MRFTRAFLFLIVAIALVPTVRADAVTDWNAVAVQASLTAGAPPGPAARVGPTSVVDIAMVSVAMYDAVQAIEKRYEPYYVEVPGASGSSAGAAARAAHDVLVYLYPAQAAALGVTYQNFLAANGILITDPGLLVGARAAPVSSLYAAVTDDSPIRLHRPMSATPTSANGAQRRRPTPRCSVHGWRTRNRFC